MNDITRTSKEMYLDAVDIAQLIDAHKREMDNGDDEPAVVLSKREAADTIEALKRLQSAPEPAHVPIPLELAKRFHESYERLSAAFGHETRPETRVFDPESPNGKLMIAVCTEILRASQPPPAEALSLLRCVYREVSDFAGVSEETMQAIELHLQSALTKSAEGG